jgi:hypothetical protein
MTSTSEDIFAEIRSELQSLDMGFEIAQPGQVPNGLSRVRIETWSSGKKLYLYMPPEARIEDGLWQAARAVGRLHGFPSDTDDLRAQALLDSWAYEISRSALSTRRAILQSGRIRARLQNEDLEAEDRVKASYAIWSILTVLSERERARWIDWLEETDPGVMICLNQIMNEWGLRGPASQVDAERMLDGENSSTG